MYTLSVPFMLSQIRDYGIRPFIDSLREVGADTVFLALDCYETDPTKQETVFAALRENVSVLQEAGFTVGVWVWTFMIRDANTYTHITSPAGKVSKEQVCPSDADFCTFAHTYMRRIAESRPDIILFDDDFRYGFLDCGLGCLCPNHRARIQQILGGEELPADLTPYLFSGGKNPYRSAYLQANGEFFRAFARGSRAAVDAVDPSIRLGLCACMTTWDFDGVSAAELARILAGNTRPFLRLIGAPYWASSRSWGNRLQDVIELERMESSWCGDDIELYAEGDAYPRPRFTCPANVLEGFDLALRASGAVSGIHKYVLDYVADTAYERGYIRKHLQNRAIGAQIDRCFSGKTPVGVRVYERCTKFETMDIPACYSGKDAVQNLFFSPASRMMAAQTIPTVYEGKGTVGIAFGENARFLPPDAAADGLILDITAAQILESLGVDVGLDSVDGSCTASREYFPQHDRYVGLFGCPASRIRVKDGAAAESYFIAGGERIIGSYSYRNTAGGSFLVFAFEGYSMSEHAFRQPARGDQICAWITRLGKRLPVSLPGNPDCYILCREDACGKAVWIGNFFADECLQTTLTLDRPYREIECIGCSGTLCGDTVHLDAIPAYASVGFLVKE